MGSSSDEGSNNERSKVTLQIHLTNGSKTLVQTQLDLTVEEFRLVLADLTGVPSDQQNLVYNGRILRDPQTLRSYGLEPDHIIHLGCRALSSSNIAPSETYGLNATNASARIQSNVDYSYFTAETEWTMVFLHYLVAKPGGDKMLESPLIVEYIVFFLLYVAINRRMASCTADITDVNAHADGHIGISLETELTKLSLRLLDLNLVGSSYSAPEVSNANRSNSAPNRDPLPNPWASSYYIESSPSYIEQVCDDDELEHIYDWQVAYSGTVDKLMPIVMSDSTLFRNCKEQGRSIDQAYAALYACNYCDIEAQSSALRSVVAELEVFFNLIERRLRELQNGMDCDPPCSSSGGGDEFAPEDEAALLEQYALELTLMEEMGFRDMEQNLRALLNSGGDMDEAVERLRRKT